MINGAIAVYLGIDSFIVTLGIGTVLSGIVLWYTNSETISGISPGLVEWVIVPKVAKIGMGFFYALVLCVFLWYLLEYTRVGRELLFVGRGRRVSRLNGIRVGWLRWGALTACGVLSAVAGVLYAGTSGSADPTSGLSFLLPAFAAAFLGSTSIVPGRFNAWGTFIAVYFLVTGITGLALLGVQVFVQDVFYGGALVIAVAIAQLARRSSGEERDPDR
jgi:ribose transport system permease protein